jgi:hypothetical protein
MDRARQAASHMDTVARPAVHWEWIPAMGSLRQAFDVRLDELTAAAAGLEEQESGLADAYSGLKDIDLSLRLAAARLDVCLHVLDRLAERPDLRETATAHALGAATILDGLAGENVSEDQRAELRKGLAWDAVRERLERFFGAGGVALLAHPDLDERRRRILAHGIAAAIRKYAAADDLSPAIDPDRYPPLVRRLLAVFFPVLARRHPEPPPYGIEEGEELEYSSDHVTLPLSQAILYLETEALPDLERRLAQSPGDRELQQEIRLTERRIEECRRLRFFPRSTPVLLEQGFHTEGMTAYSADGEMLVRIALPVRFRSGTNLDRRMELVRADLVKRLAGRRISETLDREYRRLKSLASGIRGSSRTPSFKLDAAGCFRQLKREFPALSRLEDKESFKQLAAMAGSRVPGRAERLIGEIVARDHVGKPGALTRIARSDSF